MFSGITNQVSSWMGAAKGEPQDEEVPTPTSTKDASATGGDQAADGEKQRYVREHSLFTSFIHSSVIFSGLQTGCRNLYKLFKTYLTVWSFNFSDCERNFTVAFKNCSTLYWNWFFNCKMYAMLHKHKDLEVLIQWLCWKYVGQASSSDSLMPFYWTGAKWFTKL